MCFVWKGNFYLVKKSFSYEENLLINSIAAQKLSLSSSFHNKNLNTYLKHIDYAKKKYGKSIFIEDKIGENKTFTVRLSYDLLVVKLKLAFSNDYPSTYPMVELVDKAETYNDKSMRKDIEDKISEWKNDNLSYNENIICILFNGIYSVLEKFSLNLK